MSPTTPEFCLPEPSGEPTGSLLLEDAVDALIAVGEQALADEAQYGRLWTIYADWAWRRGIDGVGSSPQDVQRWLDEDRGNHTSQTIAAVLQSIANVHRQHGFVDPTKGSAP